MTPIGFEEDEATTMFRTASANSTEQASKEPRFNHKVGMSWDEDGWDELAERSAQRRRRRRALR